MKTRILQPICKIIILHLSKGTKIKNATIISKFLLRFVESVPNFIFGVGLYECNVHCMPLQYLFGGGILLSILVLLFAFSLSSCRISHRISFSRWVPMLVTLAMSLTVPIASMLTFMFPIVIVGLFMIHSCENLKEEAL